MLIALFIVKNSENNETNFTIYLAESDLPCLFASVAFIKLKWWVFVI